MTEQDPWDDEDEYLDPILCMGTGCSTTILVTAVVLSATFLWWLLL